MNRRVIPMCSAWSLALGMVAVIPTPSPTGSIGAGGADQAAQTAEFSPVRSG